MGCEDAGVLPSPATSADQCDAYDSTHAWPCSITTLPVRPPKNR
jgi:hypothetical protein